jgi:hypothetical protein
MYARIARFEGASPEIMEREVDRLRQDIAAAKAGTPTTDSAPTALSRLIDRVLVLADHDNGVSTVIVFCDTQDKLREVDGILNAMSPESGEGRRVSRDLCEVALDESTGVSQKAA